MDGLTVAGIVIMIATITGTATGIVTERRQQSGEPAKNANTRTDAFTLVIGSVPVVAVAITSTITTDRQIAPMSDVNLHARMT